MKIFLFISSVFLFTSTAFAGYKYHAEYFWSGEYPSGYEVLKDISVNGRTIPNLDVNPSVSCKIPKGRVIHPWTEKQINAATKFLQINEISTYKLLSDYISDDSDWAKGTVVDELMYLSEGYCKYRIVSINDVQILTPHEIETTCLGAAQDINYEVIHQGTETQEWFRFSCANGAAAWFERKDFENQTRFKGAIKPAQITGYGSVQE